MIVSIRTEEISQAVSQAEQELTRYYAERQMRNAEAPREQAPAQKVVAYRFANGNPVRIMVDEDAGLDDATFKPKRSRRVSRAEAEKVCPDLCCRAALPATPPYREPGVRVQNQPTPSMRVHHRSAIRCTSVRWSISSGPLSTPVRYPPTAPSPPP